ncbi:MAG: hypothetical protein ACFB2Z_08230 [Maricaulaceae bacterium]
MTALTRPSPALLALAAALAIGLGGGWLFSAPAAQRSLDEREATWRPVTVPNYDPAAAAQALRRLQPFGAQAADSGRGGRAAASGVANRPQPRAEAGGVVVGDDRLSGVMARGDRVLVSVTPVSDPQGSARLVGVGDAVSGGWRIAAIDGVAVTLSADTDEVRIELFTGSGEEGAIRGARRRSAQTPDGGLPGETFGERLRRIRRNQR